MEEKGKEQKNLKRDTPKEASCTRRRTRLHPEVNSSFKERKRGEKVHLEDNKERRQNEPMGEMEPKRPKEKHRVKSNVRTQFISKGKKSRERSGDQPKKGLGEERGHVIKREKDILKAET